MFDRSGVGEAFGRAAEQYDAHADLQREVRDYCLELAQSCWPRDSLVLDLGCGTGALYEEAQRRDFGWNVTSLDFSPGMCKVAGKRSTQVINADAEMLPIKNGHFHGVFSSLMLQWMNKPKAALSEMARVLRPKYYAAIATFAEGTLDELRQSFRVVDNKPHVSHFIAPHQLLAEAKEAGFNLVAARQVRIVETYPDTVALMRALQSVGATNQHVRRRKGLMTSRQFAALEKAYRDRFATPQGLPATWQALYLILQKTS